MRERQKEKGEDVLENESGWTTARLDVRGLYSRLGDDDGEDRDNERKDGGPEA